MKKAIAASLITCTFIIHINTFGMLLRKQTYVKRTQKHYCIKPSDEYKNILDKRLIRNELYIRLLLHQSSKMNDIYEILKKGESALTTQDSLKFIRITDEIENIEEKIQNRLGE